ATRATSRVQYNPRGCHSRTGSTNIAPIRQCEVAVHARRAKVTDARATRVIPCRKNGRQGCSAAARRCDTAARHQTYCASKKQSADPLVSVGAVELFASTQPVSKQRPTSAKPTNTVERVAI